MEPGPAKTNFGGGLVVAPALPAYEHTPAGEVRRAMTSGAFPLPGDPHKMAQAMLDSADQHPAPRRLTLGGRAYAQIRAALTDRLAVLDAQKAIAFSTDSAS